MVSDGDTERGKIDRRILLTSLGRLELESERAKPKGIEVLRKGETQEGELELSTKGDD
jgi:hypothetical protein